MIIESKLSKYRSRAMCDLAIFHKKPFRYDEKTWRSRDGSVHLIREMDTMHLLNCYNMLMTIIKSDPDVFHENSATVFERDCAINAIRYIAYTLYERGMQVSELPNISDKDINRADDFEAGFTDEAGDAFNFDTFKTLFD